MEAAVNAGQPLEEVTDTTKSSSDNVTIENESTLNQTSDISKSEEINLVNSIEKLNISENEQNEWSSNDCLNKKMEENKSDSGGNNVPEDKVDAAKASPADSEEDEGRYSISDADDPPAVTSGEIIRIPG